VCTIPSAILALGKFLILTLEFDALGRREEIKIVLLECAWQNGGLWSRHGLSIFIGLQQRALEHLTENGAWK
jgi:hypothetical protein